MLLRMNPILKTFTMRHVNLNGVIYPVGSAYSECVAKQALADAGVDFLPFLGDLQTEGRFLYRFGYKQTRDPLIDAKRKSIMFDAPSRGRLKAVSTMYRMSESATLRHLVGLAFDNMSKSG